MASDAHLYGIRKPKTTPRAPSSSSSLAFTSTLSSLISNANAPSTQQRGRPRAPKTKEDIFATHNKNTKKRAARDLEDDGTPAQIHNAGLESVDASILHRSKRRMEEKARRYRAMKRGDHVPRDDNDADTLVDFDQKWADRQRHGDKKNTRSPSPTSSSSDDDAGEPVEYEDEYGRHVTGTKSSAARMERKKLARSRGHDELEQISARPSMPSELIHGDAVQTGAFNPEASIAERMSKLAGARDRSATPPEQQHYEASKEIRDKGVGFYGFSKGGREREEEMRGLEREREETERVRRERGERMEGRRRVVEERRRVVEEARARKRAERFLDGLEGELDGSGG